MRTPSTIYLSRKSSRVSVLAIADCEWLLINGYVRAVFFGDVFFPDIPMTRFEVKVLNDFHRMAAHSRVMTSDFDYYVASSGMRGLRPLLAKEEI